MTKRYIAFALALLGSLAAWAGTPQEDYIARYSATAVAEMYRSGVPASITLAQGILESRCGLSELAQKGNNHFGIKCHDWKGKTMKVDDDRKDECFRVYSSAAESFLDHSDFLRYRQRYSALFDLPVTDYKGWARGLSAAGYATDPQYPQKLIRIIEENNLSRFDTDAQSAVPVQDQDVLAGSSQKERVPAEKQTKKETKKETKKQVKKHQKKTQPKNEQPAANVLPLPPSVLQQDEPAPVRREREEFTFAVARKAYLRNGAAFVYSVEGDSYATLAKAYDLFPREILRLNELQVPEPLAPGTVVFIQRKRAYTPSGLDKHIVETDGESLRDICQSYGVRLDKICRLNGFSGAGHALREGDTVLLRPEKRHK